MAKEVSFNVKTINTFKYQIPTNLKNFGLIREIELLPKFPIMCHSVHWGINPPQKHHPIFFVKAPLNLHTVQVLSFLGSSSPYLIVFRETPLKVLIFHLTPIIL